MFGKALINALRNCLFQGPEGVQRVIAVLAKGSTINTHLKHNKRIKRASLFVNNGRQFEGTLREAPLP